MLKAATNVVIQCYTNAVSLLFSHRSFRISPVLIMTMNPGSHNHSLPDYAGSCMLDIMHQVGGGIRVMEFWSRFRGWSPVSLLLGHNLFHISLILITCIDPGSHRHSLPD